MYIYNLILCISLIQFFLQSNFHDIEQYKTIGFPVAAILLSSLRCLTILQRWNEICPHATAVILQYINTCMFTYTYRMLSKSWYNHREIISREKSQVKYAK